MLHATFNNNKTLCLLESLPSCILLLLCCPACTYISQLRSATGPNCTADGFTSCHITVHYECYSTCGQIIEAKNRRVLAEMQINTCSGSSEPPHQTSRLPKVSWTFFYLLFSLPSRFLLRSRRKKRRVQLMLKNNISRVRWIIIWLTK